MKFSEEEVIKAYEDAKPIIRDILEDTWINENVVLISNNIKIRIDKVEIIIKLIGFVLLDLLPLSKFIISLEKELSISKERATEIAEKVDEFVFKKVREKVKGEIKEKSNENHSKYFNDSNSKKEIKKDKDQDIREKLLRDVENHAVEDENTKEVILTDEKKDEFNDFSNMFEQNKTTISAEKNVDPYRENF